MKAFYRVVEVMEILNLGRTKTYDLIRAGVIPSVDIHGSKRVPVEEFDEVIKDLKRTRSAKTSEETGPSNQSTTSNDGTDAHPDKELRSSPGKPSRHCKRRA